MAGSTSPPPSSPVELIIGIRHVDLSVRDAAYHPMTTPWPETEPSPFADWFGETASIRDPMIWGFCPEDGSPLTVTLFSEIGGRAVGVIGMTGQRKSNVLNDAREFITRCTGRPDGAAQRRAHGR